MRMILVDVVAAVLVILYGPQACPVLEGLGHPWMVGFVVPAFLVSHALARLAERHWVEPGPVLRRPERVYVITIVRYAVLALVLPPLASVGAALRMALVLLALGHFAGVDLALARERALFASVTADAEPLVIERPRSIVRRLLGFAVGGIVSTGAVLTMLIYRDLEWLAAAQGDIGAVTQAAMLELAVVGVIALVLVTHLVASFARNLRVLLESETRVLEEVGRGELGRHAPVFSEDELGVIAEHTNRMIDGLRERRRVQDVLKKITSPEVARALLDADGLSLGGSRRTVTVLFSDVMGFTARSESAEPEEVVHDLNAYFTAMVEVVHREGGVVDKFLGDGLMAVFGLDGEPGDAASAVRAARGMVDALEALNEELPHPIRIGVGLHRGEVVAGTIGSPDRMEFTVIGDTVNTAARIESLSREANETVLASDAVLAALNTSERGGWGACGSFPVKGRRQPVEVHGLRTPGA